MRILVLGGDGYLGWPTALHLSSAEPRRRRRRQLCAASIRQRDGCRQPGARSGSCKGGSRPGRRSRATRSRPFIGDLTDHVFVEQTIREFAPDAVVHFAEQRSAPYSMIDREHAVYTQVNNVVGTLNLLYAIAEIDPTIHLVKLGTMGEYGTPNIDIEEGFIEITHKGRTDVLPYPKQPGSLLPPVQGARQPQHPVRLPHLGPSLDRPEPGHRLRAGDTGDDAAPRPADPFRLRRRCSGRCSTALPSRRQLATR